MPVSFESIRVGSTWNRNQLAELWGYQGREAISRGAITPRGTNLIVLFITHEKQTSATQYEDVLEDNILNMDGEERHSTDQRIINAEAVGDDIHLFYRHRHHLPFAYYGRIRLLEHQLFTDRPSRFQFRLMEG